ncbi:hypothetical protein SAMN04488543_3405 [Friedmanniella luteola]|uniref:DUF4190 domain-containing protein n=1 Tax=Friedmanniella luteola TaxID=546871 RepID=A0A1H1YQN3_9ACTN|nr:DUF4190 domain-containing protein [Friedmanniella luteola]SDT23785.1 hypothetical protein SAMN04488543_3405 [Friedmanniella luteola]
MSDQPSGPVHPSDPGADGPDPFSREGAAASGAGDQPAGPPEQHQDATPPPPAGAEYPLYGQPPTGPPYPPAPLHPSAQPYQPPAPYQPAPPYQAPWAEQPPSGGYGSPADPQGYGTPAPPGVPAAYGPPAAGYGPPYGYGYGPTDHPKAVPALVTGIIGLVLSLFCGVGGLVGIAGVVQGARAKREIDGDPARWTGRSKAHAGLVTGIVGLAVLGVWALVFVISGLSGS